jgi:glyoxalase family protein
MLPQITGLHHVTAIASDPQQNVDFYAGLLGLRLVKQTVNFDDPQSYHLYYGDGLGNPGTLLTFFAWPHGRRGRPGLGQVTAAGLAIGPHSLDFWRERLTKHGVALGEPETRFGETVLAFPDPDGMRLELVPTPNDPRAGWTHGPVPAEHAIKGIHSVTLPERSVDQTAGLLTQALGFHSVATDGTLTRYASGLNPVTFADIVFVPNTVSGQISVGSIHHVAWRTPNDIQQKVWLETLADLGYGVSPVMDRDYFHSIYFREPGGILFEIATDPPGFTIDEPLETLGERLQLPAQFAPMRAQITAQLPPLRLPEPR